MLSKRTGGAIKRIRPANTLLTRLRRDPDVERLVKRGLRLGRNVFIGRDAYLAELCPWLLTIGDDVTIGMHVTIYTHDSSTKRRIGYTVVSPVEISERAYIGGLCVVLPGVTIGANAVVGAGSVVRQDVPPDAVVAGSPARVVGSIEEFRRRNADRLEKSPRYESVWALGGIGGAVPVELQERMRADLSGGKVGFIP